MSQTLQNIQVSPNVIEPIRGGYSFHYQPFYTDKQELENSKRHLESMAGVTTSENILSLRDELAQVAVEATRSVVISGRCAEPVCDSRENLDRLVAGVLVDSAVVSRAGLVDAIFISRGRGQSAKPRSSEFETTKAGEKIPSFMGDMINSEDPDSREPDARRMVASAKQAEELEVRLQSAHGDHIPSAHEALLLPFEESFVREIDGKKFLLSADMPWVGARTNNPDGPHVALLSDIENPVGVKISATSDEGHIRRLSEKLNPESHPGKLSFMVRVGEDKPEKIAEIVEAIKLHAPGSIVLYDIHGSTKQVEKNGNVYKVRSVETVKREIRQLDNICSLAGVALNGVHLETQGDDGRVECVDRDGEIPMHPGGIDPQLSPRQFAAVLEAL